MKKTLLTYFAFVAFILSSCHAGDPIATSQSGDFKIEYLFTKDGCKVYRFRDGGRYIYWSNCQGRIQSDYEVRNHKNRYHTEHVESFTNR